MRFPRKTALTAAVLLILLAALHLRVPSKGFDPALIAGLWRIHPKPAAHSSHPAVPPLSGPDGAKPPAEGAARAHVVHPRLAEFLFDDTGALDPFFAALAGLESSSAPAHVAILHYGDSPTTADLITGDIRALLQQRFGDAGHGYLLPAKPWAWYGHRGTDIAAKGWTISTAVGKGHADTYGLGGASFDGGSGASSHITVKDGTQTGMEISFLAQPGGGTVAVTATTPGAPSQPIATIDTRAEARAPGWQAIPLPPGTTAVDLKTVSGRAELFGETFTRASRGVLYDSLGLNGASTTVLSRGFDPAIWTAELQHDAPALVVINYGTNESSSAAFVDKQYEAELRRAIDRIRSALPNVSILIMSPMDRGQRSGVDRIDTMATIPQIVAIQKYVAADAHCAFFSTFEAMGGDGTMARWYTGHPRMVAGDLIHPTPQGASLIAQTFVHDLLQGYDAYKAHRPAPAPSSSGQPAPQQGKVSAE